MRVVVAYESMFGNTRAVAAAIADGFSGDVTVVPARQLHEVALAEGDVVIVGAPTHVHGLPGVRSRDAAVEMASSTDKHLSLEPEVTSPGVKEWLESADLHGVVAAAFDTRFNGPRAFTGSAAHAIARRLRRHGAHLADDVGSFLVDSSNALLPGELERARVWGQRLALRARPAVAASA